MASTGAVVAVMVLSLVMPASQDGNHHSTQWAKKDVMWDGGQLSTHYAKMYTEKK